LIAGAHTIFNLDPATVQERRIFNVQPFDQMPSAQKHDISILKTNRPFQMNRFVQKINLPDNGFKPPGNFNTIIISILFSI
jgi:hypothetical protein